MYGPNAFHDVHVHLLVAFLIQQPAEHRKQRLRHNLPFTRWCRPQNLSLVFFLDQIPPHLQNAIARRIGQNHVTLPIQSDHGIVHTAQHAG
ncbi:hypothetical protein D3C74_285360 [compost metagenome]